MPINTGAVHLIGRACRDLQVALPETLTAAIEQAREFVQAAENIDGSPSRLHDSVLDCIERGDSYITDKNVHELLVSHLLSAHGLGQAARQRSDRTVQAALVEHADSLLTAWSSTLQSHSAAIVEAAAVLNVERLDDAQAISSQGPAALRAWADATESQRSFNSAADGAMALASVARVNTDSAHGRALMYAEPDLDVFDTIRAAGQPVDAWTLARSGITPALVDSLATYMERSSMLAQQRRAILDTEQQSTQPRRKAAHAT